MHDRNTRANDAGQGSLPGPDDVLRQELPNQAIVLARESFAASSVNLLVNLSTGSLDDPLEKSGLADLTASALTRGTHRRTFQEIYEILEAQGAMLSVGVGAHSTILTAKGLAEDTESMLELISDVLFEPTFPEGEVELLRGQKLTALAIRDEETRAVAQQAFNDLAYEDHPYRVPSDGFRETVVPLVSGDLRNFHERTYGPQNMIIVVVGAIQRQNAADLVAKHLGGWENTHQKPRADLPPTKPLKARVRRDAFLAGKVQSDIIIGVPGPRRKDQDYLPAALGNSALGRFGMMGRIGEVVREQAGLAYYAYSSVVGGLGPGPWQVMAGVNPANLERAIDLILQELRHVFSDGITAQELADNQANFIGRLPLRLESNMGVASALMHIERYGLGLDYYRRFAQEISAVRLEDVHRALKAYLNPDRVAIGVAGPTGKGD
ncbi:MAG TPA: insulinase family protein [Anaerolineae bacterium]|nr:insulinase family protein [Anaerolineae bacterium]